MLINHRPKTWTCPFHGENSTTPCKSSGGQRRGDGRIHSDHRSACQAGRRRPFADLRAVLSHEWAHLRHRDLWLLALGRCLLAVFFAHPLFWWLRRAIRNDQELLADAAAAGDNRHDYAEELIRLIRKTTQPSPMAFSAAMGIWEGSSQLTRRISMLLDDTFRVHPTGSRRWRFKLSWL